MNYALGHAVSANELFKSFPIEKLKIATKTMMEKFKDRHKDRLMARIFLRSVELVVEDIVENNVHFKIPTYGTQEPYLYMKRFTGAEFKKQYNMGKWQEIDIFESYMTGYQIFLRFQTHSGIIYEKPVYIGGPLKDKLVKYTNSGRQY